jgi:Zn-dependent protease with chaperone function
MKSVELPYPVSPTYSDKSFLAPSPAFRKQVIQVMGAILLFFVVYLLLFLLAVGLAIGCMIGGVAVITSLANFLGLLLGVGMIGMGLLVLFFLIKFLFAVSRFDRSGSIEINEEEQPMLFEFVRRLAKETGTRFPKRIYLSADVNACVFYDSSFWSMFFPVKKNLQIGLGLVNTINLGEFKAVVAHEFGHFSQNSMKLGSFVYQVNRIIHNMLFDNNSYTSILNTWANLSGVFQLFAHITVGILRAIQWILRQMYGFINKKYLGLSREMEFHADAVAAGASGGNNLASALRRIEVSGLAFQLMIDKYNDLWKEKRISANAYPDQLSVLQQLAREWELPIEGSLPVVTGSSFLSSNYTRVNFKDQWASHPATEDRIRHLEALGVNAAPDSRPAWLLFSSSETIQQELTGKLYEGVNDRESASIIDNRAFQEYLLHSLQSYELPKEYHGFYDGRNFLTVNEQEWDDLRNAGSSKNWGDLFTKENGQLSKRQEGIAADLNTLNALSTGEVDIKTFDFDGTKYGKDQIKKIRELLQQEQQQLEESQLMLDRATLAFFIRESYAVSEEEGSGLKSKYRLYYQSRALYEELVADFNRTFNDLQSIYAGETIPVGTIRQMIDTLKERNEPVLKKQMESWMAKGAFNDNPTGRQKLEKFLQADYAYFSDTSFFETELAELYEVSTTLLSAAHLSVFSEWKQLLLFQLKYAPVTVSHQ